MMEGEIIGTIKLASGVTYWSDMEFTHIVLNKWQKTANVYSDCFLSNVIYGLRNGLIKLIAGDIPYRTGEEIDADLAKPAPDDLFDPMPWFIGLNDATAGMYVEFPALEGVRAMNNWQEDLTNRIKVTGTVDVNVPGKYELTYEVSDTRGNHRKQKRSVVVVDNIPPVLGGVDDKTIAVGNTFDPKEGVTAVDNIYGSEVIRFLKYVIKDSNETEVDAVDTSAAGEYTINYSVRDYHNNTSTATRKITVVDDTVAPAFYGLEDKTINIGDEWNDMDGVTAVDDIDGDLTDKVTVTRTGYTIPEFNPADLEDESADSTENEQKNPVE